MNKERYIPMKARFWSRCAGCSEPITKGLAIYYDLQTRHAFHNLCVPAPIPSTGPQQESDQGQKPTEALHRFHTSW